MVAWLRGVAAPIDPERVIGGIDAARDKRQQARQHGDAAARGRQTRKPPKTLTHDCLLKKWIDASRGVH
jgi:hypothetical protein